MALTVEDFIARWRVSGAEERANKDSFFIDLCEALGVPRPLPKRSDPKLDTYVFEADVIVPHDGRPTTVDKIDVYRAGCFIFEAKQAKDADDRVAAKKKHKLTRDTPAWEQAMADARGQALGYARMMDRPPPFLVVADLGYCFDLYATFDGSDQYRPFPTARASRLFVRDLAEHADLLRRVLDDPASLDTSKQAAKITREVAGHIAELSQELTEAKHPPELVAKFLMRCLFTMFAEDVGLLPKDPRSGEGLFTTALADYWQPAPASFPAGIERLWRAMNDGGEFGFVAKLLRFNGGLFADAAALPLDAGQLQKLLDAAKCNWSDVEPAIFGTLLERALDEKERHALGAHYTPRAYVERLVRPTIEEPLRADWNVVEVEVAALVAEAGPEPERPVLSEAQKRALGKKADHALRQQYERAVSARKAKLEEARGLVRGFHEKLTKMRVLDPACGSGNFLYVALDLFQRLEEEVLAKLRALGDTQERVRVTPAQFLGIEKKPWAKEIAELVLWIGYLQHHVRAYGKASPPPEPVLQDYKNIQCRDAVLAWDREELVRDEKGKPVSRWDGETMRVNKATGAVVPDESSRVEVCEYFGARKAEWPRADFIVGNPPFMGGWRMRQMLGEGYVAAFRAAYPDLPEKADYVMAWWQRAAQAARAGQIRRFGLITTNSITQTFQRRVLAAEMEAGPTPLRLVFAIPDHPWVDDRTAAAVRVAMTVGTSAKLDSDAAPQIALLQDDARASDTALRVTHVGIIRADLRAGANVASCAPLRSNAGMASPGMQLFGAGFLIDDATAERLARGVSADVQRRVVRPFLNGRDLTASTRGLLAIDFSGLTVDEARRMHPPAFQHVVEHVKPGRDANRVPYLSERWWLFGRERIAWREAMRGCARYFATPETSKHRTFVFVPADVLPDNKLWAFAFDDALALGVLSGRAHVVWALTSGSRLEDRPVYNKVCFEAFPFPVCTPAQAARIRALGEELDAHRKRQQAAHPGLTITGMYNVLEKLRADEPLAAKDKAIHDQGLISVLRQLHDDLDAAVFDAYGWPRDLTDEQILEKLVALNAERAEEEKNGLVRWLRPDFQNPAGATAAEQPALPAADADAEEQPDAGADGTATARERAPAAPWPKSLPDQFATLRDLVGRSGAAWTAKQAAAHFKGVSDKGVAPVLDSLVAVGLAVAYERGGERRWRAARAG
jgi:hypothetical protein